MTVRWRETDRAHGDSDVAALVTAGFLLLVVVYVVAQLLVALGMGALS